jgi:delta 1-pyrroline-5-carboxylate dehydrogenase
VFKPAEDTPLTALYLAEIIKASVPNGLFNVVLGPASVGEMLVKHEMVAKVAFACVLRNPHLRLVIGYPGVFYGSRKHGT